MHGLRAAVLFGALAASVACAVGGNGGRGPAAPAAGLVPFSGGESMARLARSAHKVDFFHLANQFEGQTNKVFCGPATAAIVLNTLRAGNDRLDKPRDPSLLPADLPTTRPSGMALLFQRYTQHTVFTARTDAVKTRAEVLGQPHAPGAAPDPGLQLRQLHEILLANGLDSRLRIADDGLPDDVIRRELTANLASADDYVIVNYFRPALGQQGGGHISPLGAYDEESDSFLILDVNPNGHAWVWAPAAALIGALRTFDQLENRGYLLVGEGHP